MLVIVSSVLYIGIESKELKFLAATWLREEEEEKDLVQMLSFEVDGKNFVIEDWRGGDA